MSIPLQSEIHYPESDGRPMGETQAHVQVILDLIHVLNVHFAGVPDVYAWGNMFLYYVEGNNKACVAPDTFLARGVGKEIRRTFKVWEEGRAPSLVFEITSASTRKEDLEKKKLYERLGVEEYFLFDPLGEYLRPRLQGYRLKEGRYQSLSPATDGSFESRTADLILKPEGYRLRLRDRETGKVLLWAEEEAAARLAAEELAEQEAQARLAAEERIRSLEEELRRFRAPK